MYRKLKYKHVLKDKSEEGHKTSKKIPAKLMFRLSRGWRECETTEKGSLKLHSKQEEQVKAKLIAWGRWNNINMTESRPTQLFGFSIKESDLQPGMCNRNMDKK